MTSDTSGAARDGLGRMELAYYDVGAGPCVVLMHGHPSDRSLWQPQLSALADDFRVLAPDPRGFGQSLGTPRSVSMRKYAEDTVELLDRLGVDRAAIVELSTGGLVAMEVATARPERCWAVGLVTTTAEPVAPERALRRERADLVERDGMQVLIDYMHTGVYPLRCPPTVRDRVDAMMTRARRRARPCAAARGVPRLSPATARARCARIRVHGLRGPVVERGGDRREPPTAGAGRHRRRRTSPNLEAEDAFNDALAGFLKRHAPT